MAKKILCTGMICYPDSIPNKDTFLSEIEKSISVGFKCILHDKDKDKNGNLKKAHFHLLFQGILSQCEWKRIYALTGIKHHEDFFTAEASLDYLTHENSPEKFHYSKDDIQTSSTWNEDVWEHILEKEKKIAEDKDENVDFTIDILGEIEKNNILSFKVLSKHVMSNMSKDHFRILIKNTYFFSQYLRG